MQMHKYHIFLLSFLLGSCHVGEEYHHTEIITPYDVQENLNLKKNGNSVSSAWYEIFKDSDLNTLINHALNNNFTIRQGIERLQQSRYSLMINAKTSYPMIDANGEYNFSKASDNQDYSYDINAFKVGLDASWELDIWGKGKYITEQYYELMHNYQYTLLDLKVSITAEVTGNYIGLREAQEKLFIAQKNLALQQDILQTVRDKYTAGIADELALNQAEYAVETTKSSIPPLKQQIESYKNAIAVLLGVLPSNLPINLDKYKKNITATTFNYSTKKGITLLYFLLYLYYSLINNHHMYKIHMYYNLLYLFDLYMFHLLVYSLLHLHFFLYKILNYYFYTLHYMLYYLYIFHIYFVLSMLLLPIHYFYSYVYLLHYLQIQNYFLFVPYFYLQKRNYLDYYFLNLLHLVLLLFH